MTHAPGVLHHLADLLARFGKKNRSQLCPASTRPAFCHHGRHQGLWKPCAVVLYCLGSIRVSLGQLHLNWGLRLQCPSYNRHAPLRYKAGKEEEERVLRDLACPTSCLASMCKPCPQQATIYWTAIVIWLGHSMTWGGM